MIRVDERGAITLVTLDRPERRNALHVDGCRALAEAVGATVARSARVLVLTGAGGHFCAGADLTTVDDPAFGPALRAALDALVHAPLVAIAAVEGAALGAGVQLAVSCDLRVATPAARFGIPAAKLGLMVDHWTVRRVAHLAGGGPARAMLLAAEEVSGAEAVRLGLANRAGGLDEAWAWAEAIADLAPLSVAGHKLALNRVEADHPPDAEVADAFRRAWASADLAEGRAAFAARRPPRFQGC